jgi:uncharacterized protein (DUF169 family)
MTDYRSLATDIRALLELETPPVALALMAERPASVPTTTAVSPSACGFWRYAETEVLYASAEQHFSCQMGAMVMGFSLPQAITDQLGGLVESMCAAGYLAPDEAAKVPAVTSPPTGIVYGPLGDIPVAPHAVLLWLRAKQAMLFNEAIGAAAWTTESVRVGGRPGCAAIPIATESGTPTLTLGCSGMRTFTEISDDRMLAVVPGDRLVWFVDRLRVISQANAEMLDYYRKRKAEVAAPQTLRAVNISG